MQHFRRHFVDLINNSKEKKISLTFGRDETYPADSSFFGEEYLHQF
jgi:hypothetical protein